MSRPLSTAEPVLTLRRERAGEATPLDLTLRAGQSKVLLLPDIELAEVEEILAGEKTSPNLSATLFGLSPAQPGVWTDDLAGRVSRTFSPLFGRGCWLEQLNIDENLMLAPLMRGERLRSARQRAQELAQRFSLPDIPRTRRSATPPATLTLCQWIRAFLMDKAELFLMVDAFRDTPTHAMSALVKECQALRQRGAAFLWLLPEADARRAQQLETEFPSTPSPASGGALP